MLNELYPDNGMVRLEPPMFPRLARPKQVIKTLESTFHVPTQVIEDLAVAFGRAAADVVDDAVAQKKQPLGYYIVRRLDGDEWWNR